MATQPHTLRNIENQVIKITQSYEFDDIVTDVNLLECIFNDGVIHRRHDDNGEVYKPGMPPQVLRQFQPVQCRYLIISNQKRVGIT